MKNVFKFVRLICLAGSMYGSYSRCCDVSISPKNNSPYAQWQVHELQKERLAKNLQLRLLAKKSLEHLAHIPRKDPQGFKRPKGILSAKRRLDFKERAFKKRAEETNTPLFLFCTEEL